MAQDFTVAANNQPIDRTRLASLQKLAKQNGEVFPFDTQTVYATQKLVDAKSIPEIHKVGQAIEVHPATAAKMIEHGKATAEAPEAEEKAKPAQKAAAKQADADSK